MCMRRIAALINERKRKMESLQKLAEWQNGVNDWQVGARVILTAVSSSSSPFPTRWGQRPEFLISRMFCPAHPPG